ncbi:MAG: hypothetical protein JO079_02170 [Frankiaceae bacterium]|nr:hypothetical protein [Frankiaceae bacterium]MBV9370012.1 hypothetical protein [Frankiales bacterium]
MNSLAVGADGYVYATQGNPTSGGDQIFRINPTSGAMTTWWTGSASEHVSGITSDGTGLYVAAYADTGGTNEILYFTLGTTPTVTTLVASDPALGGTTLAYLNGYVFADGATPGSGGPLLRRYNTTDGSVTNIAGSGSGYQEGTGANAWFGRIGQIATDGTNLYVADATNNRIREVVSATALTAGEQAPVTSGAAVPLGQAYTVAGSGSSTTSAGAAAAAGFNSPQGVAVIGNYAYVASTDAISKVSLTNGSTTILAGLPGCTSCADVDSTTGSSARFQPLVDLASDGSFLYALEGPVATLRRIDPTTGATSTVWKVPQNKRGDDLTVGPDGSLYFTTGDPTNGGIAIYKFNPATSVGASYFTPTFLTFLPHNTMTQSVAGIAADATKLYYVVTDGYEGAIVTVPLSGTLTQTALTSSDPQLAFGQHLALAGQYLYAGGWSSSASRPGLLLRYPKAGGSSNIVAGGGPGPNLDALGNNAVFANVQGIVSDGGRLLVADSKYSTSTDNRLRVVVAAKTAASGGGPAYPGELVGNGPGYEPVTSCSCQDPVNTATGAAWESATDLAVPGRGPALSLSRTYDSQKAVVNGPLGYGWSTSYGTHLAVDPVYGSGTLTTTPVLDVVTANGSTLPFTLQSGGTYTAPSRVQATLTHNSGGTWTFVGDARDTYTFNSTGALTGLTDLNGYTTTLAYASGRLTTVTDPASRTFTFAYGTNGDISTVTDSSGRQVSYGYDVNGNLTSVTDPAGHAWTYGYASGHLLTTITDPRSHSTTNTYDSAGRVISQTDRNSHTTTFAYGVPTAAGSGVTTMTDGRNLVTSYTYSDGDLTAVSRAVGSSAQATWTYTYDATTNAVASVSDPLNHTTSYTYDAHGNRLTATDGLNHSESWSYNALNEPLTHTDRTNVTTTYTYDTAGNLLTVAKPLNGSTTATTTNTYGDSTHPGDVTAVTDPRGKISHFTYDSYGQLTSSSDPLGDTTTSSYTCTPAGAGCRSNIGWAYSTVSPRGNVTGGTPSAFTTSYTRDDNGHVLTATDPLGHTTTTVYDANGNVSSVTDANSHQTSYTYDNNDERTVTTRADLTTLTDAYDADGNRTSYTDGNNHTTSYAYDSLNRLASVTDALNRTTSYSYDLAGNLTSVVNPSNKTTTYGYDADNRRTSISYSDTTTPNVTYGYDNDGRRTSMSDGSGNSSYTYDALGRLTSHTDGAGQVVGYGYDLDGDVTSLTYPNSKTVTRGYDDAGHLTTVTDWNSKTHTFSYDADGNLTSAAAPNGVTESTTLNNADQVTAMADTTGSAPNVTTLASYTYTRDPLGLLTATTPTGATAQTNETYAHSSLNQLTTYATATTSGSYSYDHGDNVTGLADSTSQTFDNADQLATAGGITFGYNAQGDRTTATSTVATATYGYDQANRLTSYSANGVPNSTYAYDGDGLRTAKTGANFAWDHVTAQTPLLLTDGSENYLYGPNHEVIEQIANFTPAISLVGTGSGVDSAGTASTVTATFSQPAAANDQILVAVSAKQAQNPAMPAGYVAVGGSGSATDQTILYRTTAVGGETGVTVTFNQGTTVHAKTVLAAIYRGVDPVEPVEPNPSGTINNFPGTSLVVLGDNVTRPNEELIFLANAMDNSLPATWTAPAGMTSEVAAGASTVATMIADQTEAATGYSGSRTATIDQSAMLLGAQFALRPAPDTYYYSHDQQGSTRLLTGPDAAVYATYAYDPYGRTTSHTGPVSTPLLYDGQYQDSESGLYYLRARYYDPNSTQFLTRDPLETITRQPYEYGGNQPLDYADPTGLCNSDVISVSFWTSGNCLSGAVGGPNGGGSESIGGVVKSVTGIAGGAAAVTAVVATGGLAAGAFAGGTEVATTTAVFDGSGAMTEFTFSVDTLPSAAEDLATFSGQVGTYSAFGHGLASCAGAVRTGSGWTDCGWDAATGVFGFGTGIWPGGFPGALLGLLSNYPNPFGGEPCQRG